MKINKIKEMSSPDLEKELGELKTELFKLKFSLATNGLDNPMKIKEVKISGPGSLVILSLEDWHGSLYETEVDLKYDVIVRNENYIEDFFGFEDIHKKSNTTIIIVTHNIAIADMSDHIIEIRDGVVALDQHNDKVLSASEVEW